VARLLILPQLPTLWVPRPCIFEAVTKLVPSAKADSICSTFSFPALRAGLSHTAATRLDLGFVPPLVVDTELRNSLFFARAGTMLPKAEPYATRPPNEISPHPSFTRTRPGSSSQ
jgi:hypothetical protein